MRSIGLLERSNLFGRKPQRERCGGIRKMVRLRSPDNWRRDCRLAEHPGKRYLSAGSATLLGDPPHAVDDCVVKLFGLRVHAFPELVGFIAFGAFGLPGAGQAATCEGTPGDDADTFGLAKRDHLALLFTIEQV